MAGVYGDYNCDTPPDAIDEMLDRIKALYTPDLILISGGLVSRDLNLNQAAALTSLGKTLDMIRSKF